MAEERKHPPSPRSLLRARERGDAPRLRPAFGLVAAAVLLGGVAATAPRWTGALFALWTPQVGTAPLHPLTNASVREAGDGAEFSTNASVREAGDGAEFSTNASVREAGDGAEFSTNASVREAGDGAEFSTNAFLANPLASIDLPLAPFAGAAVVSIALAFLARGGISPRKRPRAAPRWPFAPRTDLLADRAAGLLLGGAVLVAGTASLLLLGISGIYRGGVAGIPPTLATTLGPAVAVGVGLVALDGVRRYRAFLARHRRSDGEKRREDREANGSPEAARARDRSRAEAALSGDADGAPAAVVVADGAADSPAYCIYFRSVDRAPWVGAVVPQRDLPSATPAPFHDRELAKNLADLPLRAPIPEAHFAVLARAFPRA